VAGNDFVISGHILFGHTVATICPPRTCNVQVKNASTLEDERISFFLERLQVPEYEISGTLSLLIKSTLLILAKIIQVTVLPYIESDTTLHSKRKCYKEGVSSQNCIFGCSLMDK